MREEDILKYRLGWYNNKSESTDDNTQAIVHALYMIAERLEVQNKLLWRLVCKG